MLGIRYHRNMMQKGSFQPYVSNNVCFFNDIADASILLREARALITDYSSIYLDFMVLDRPVILYTPDIQDYKGNRGFNYLPDEFIPTDSPATTFEDICGQIETSLQPNFTPCLKYLDVKSRFHKYELDGRCSDRLLAAIQD